MPSVVAGISDDLDDFLDWLVETNRFETRSEAARHLMEYASLHKYDTRV